MIEREALKEDSMKYIVILCDGMADEPIDALGGKTPIEAARTENMDRLAKDAEIGVVRTVPEGMTPGSDTANLSVIGYDPKKYYSGRSPLAEHRRQDGGWRRVLPLQPCDSFRERDGL